MTIIAITENCADELKNRLINHVVYRWGSEYKVYIVKDKKALTELEIFKRFPSCKIFICEQENIVDKNTIFKKLQVYFPNLDAHAGLVPLNFSEFDYEYINSHIFGEISKKNGYAPYYFPYTFLSRNNAFGDIDELGFRLPNNWKNLKKRKNNHKLILFFGNSSCFDQLSHVGYRFTDILEQKLNQAYKDLTFTVLNFGMTSALVVNEMAIYTLFAFDLNADIVISHSGYTDLLHGQISDNFLLTNYRLSYAKFYETWAAKVHDYDEKLLFKQVSTMLPCNPANIVCDSYVSKIAQFAKYVNSYDNATFIVGLQPLIFMKKDISENEKLTSRKFAIDKKLSFVEKNLENLYKLTTKKLNHTCIQFVNFETSFSQYGCDCELFLDVVHQLGNANEIIANEYFEYINTFFKS